MTEAWGNLTTMDMATAAWHVARDHPRGLPQIRLLKLLWLAELRHFERYGRRLTDAGWFRWNNGPYSKDIINEVKANQQAFNVVHTTVPQTGHAMVEVHAALQPDESSAQEELQTLRDVLWEYSSYTDEELLAEVYADPFFERFKKGQDFDFRQLKAAHELSLSQAEIDRILDSPLN